ncbi:tRNA dihydrouridine synthase DusB [Corynebacterium sp.]|mgnify:CR=1 FL=1|uniref:tRNA dihydrouridine synthase DusB n=1 Tax=Corynebacterium sp. TaxID=1720 RepID=UPI0025BD1ABA|nr:tRNA dihydrouridine synthase DusB [Corynebacterium sp.]
MSTATTTAPAPALSIGRFDLDSPVVLAPMAGVTNVAFRTLCREQERQRMGSVAGLYVCEMVTARALVERNPKTMHMTTFAPDEDPRSLQLYTTDPEYTYRAARMIAEEDLADHIDMNFGCPVPKVTRRGGGSALPFKRRLYASIVRAAVSAVSDAGRSDIPVTVKFRVGIDDDHLTHLDAGRIAADEGAAAVACHGRTAAQRYSGTADWGQIARLVEHMEGTGVPVLGNGDIFKASDAATMMARTGCDGVVVGRGCLGRPWLFAELSAHLRGLPVPEEPTLAEVCRIIMRHAELLSAHEGETYGVREMRKHMAWYMRGFPAGGEIRRQLSQITDLESLRAVLDPMWGSDARAVDADGPRGRQGSPGKVALPDGWLDDPEDLTSSVPEDPDADGAAANGG